jgi:hypothetical protein
MRTDRTFRTGAYAGSFRSAYVSTTKVTVRERCRSASLRPRATNVVCLPEPGCLGTVGLVQGTAWQPASPEGELDREFGVRGGGQ